MIVRTKVIDILADRLGKDKATIADQTNVIGDLGADSLDIAEILMDLEDAFGIRLDSGTSEAPTFKTVGDVIHLVEAEVSKHS